MSVPPISSNGQLDTQIAQLIQCKPLSEVEVRPVLPRCCYLSKWMRLSCRSSGDVA